MMGWGLQAIQTEESAVAVPYRAGERVSDGLRQSAPPVVSGVQDVRWLRVVRCRCPPGAVRCARCRTPGLLRLLRPCPAAPWGVRWTRQRPYDCPAAVRFRWSGPRPSRRCGRVSGRGVRQGVRCPARCPTRRGLAPGRPDTRRRSHRAASTAPGAAAGCHTLPQSVGGPTGTDRRGGGRWSGAASGAGPVRPAGPAAHAARRGPGSSPGE
jgi:hypothetical protein